MTDKIIMHEKLKPVDDTSDVQFPPHFADALGEVRSAIARCDEQSIPKDSIPLIFATFNFIFVFGMIVPGGA